MTKYLKFFRNVWIHKWYVMIMGLRLGVPFWRLVIHDFRKLHLKNFIPYAQRFFGDSYDEDEFMYVWLDHQNTCPHHWEYWISRSSHTKSTDPDRSLNSEPLPMPEWAVREMVADWLGASKVYAKIEVTSLDSWKWYNENFPHIQNNLHPSTIILLEKVLEEYMNNVGKT